MQVRLLMAPNVERGRTGEKRSFRIREGPLHSETDVRVGLDEQFLCLRRAHRPVLPR